MGGGALKDLVAVGQDDVEQLRCQSPAQLVQSSTVALNEPIVGSGVEGVQACGSGPLPKGGPSLEGRRIGTIPGFSGVPELGEHLSGSTVGGATRSRLVQAAAVGVELGADHCQLGTQRGRSGAAGHLTGTVSGLFSPQGQSPAQGSTDLGRLHAVIVQIEQ